MFDNHEAVLKNSLIFSSCTRKDTFDNFKVCISLNFFAKHKTVIWSFNCQGKQETPASLLLSFLKTTRAMTDWQMKKEKPSNTSEGK